MVNVIRLLIISAFFVVGLIIGNIYLPQKNFDQKNIVVPQKPKVSFNVDTVPQVETILKEADKYKNILIESGHDQEEIIGFENNFKRTLIQLYYKEAAANYALELLKLQMQPENTVQYIKAREEYKKFINLLESLYPLEVPKEVLVIKDENQSLVPSSLTLQNMDNTEIPADTLKVASTETVQVSSSESAAKIVSSTTQTN